MNNSVKVLIATFCSILLSACGSGSDTSGTSNPSPVPETMETPVTQGKALYESPMSNGNSFACATCHALTEPATDGFARPGHPIGDALRRTSFKNGQLATFLEAANSCLTEWMNAPEWSSSSAEYENFVSYLNDVDTEEGSVANLSYTIDTDYIRDTYEGGSAIAGETLFNTSCAICHGLDGVGTERGLPLTGRVFEPELIARRVRTSGRTTSAVYSDLTGGVMPFWSEERLSDSELLDIIAYLKAAEGSNTDNGGDGSDNSGGENTGSCASTHPKIGQSAQLSAFAHGVSGTATIIDDCTVRIDAFNYDGQGINVRIYGGKNNQYEVSNGGFALSGNNLLRNTPYSNESITVTLPAGKTFDDLDGISVWCVPIGVSFGDGQFQ